MVRVPVLPVPLGSVFDAVVCVLTTAGFHATVDYRFTEYSYYEDLYERLDRWFAEEEDNYPEALALSPATMSSTKKQADVPIHVVDPFEPWRESEFYQGKLHSVVFESGIRPPKKSSKSTNTRNLLSEVYTRPAQGDGVSDSAWLLQIENCYEKWGGDRLWSHFRRSAELDDAYEDEEFPLDQSILEDDDYSRNNRYFLSPSEMKDLVSGQNISSDDFFRAEGQLARLMIMADNQSARVAVMKLWCIIVAHQFSLRTSMRCVKAVLAAEKAHTSIMCAEDKEDFLRGFCRYNTSMIRLESVWTYAVKSVVEIREEFWRDCAHVVKCCGFHGRYCRSAHGLSEGPGLSPSNRHSLPESDDSDDEVVQRRRRLLK